MLNRRLKEGQLLASAFRLAQDAKSFKDGFLPTGAYDRRYSRADPRPLLESLMHLASSLRQDALSILRSWISRRWD
jgi:hypothetical protein